MTEPISKDRVIFEDTDGNQLTEYVFDPEMCDLITRCVEDVVPLLSINPKVKVFGKEGIQHRNVGLFSTDPAIKYAYSGFQCENQPASPNVEKLLYEINRFFPGSNYNAILVNQYMTGDDYISDHSDDEKTVSSEVGVLSISYGSEREFQVKRKGTKELVAATKTRSHTMLQMFGSTFQKKYLHGIPRTKKRDPPITEPRVSFTFRSHKTCTK
jgi:alkylated DNA repair dioxygenase AlkB